MKQMILQIWNDILHLLYPNICLICGDILIEGEKYICLNCHYNLPLVSSEAAVNNPTEKLFAGRFMFSQAEAWLFFQKGNSVQTLIHAIKYHGNKQLAYLLGREAALKLTKTDLFKNIAYLVPIPLHHKRLKQRGYNQSEWIAKGMASVLNIEIDTVTLIRKKHNKSQTTKGVFDRWDNVHYIFELRNPEKFSNKHILLIDDVITTGATMNAAAELILKNNTTEISLFSIALTQR